MIDRLIYKFFAWLDDCFEKVDDVLAFDWPNCKKKKKTKKK